MARIIMEQVFEPPMSEEKYAELAKRLDPCLDTHGAAWRRSYVSTDRRRMTCEFEAADADSIRHAARSANVPFERVWAAECFAAEDYPEHMEKLRKLTAK